MSEQCRKQTSSRVSSKAARLLSKLPKRGRVVVIYSAGRGFERQETVCSVATLLSICGSALVQDETPRIVIGSRNSDSLTVRNPKSRKKRKGARR